MNEAVTDNKGPEPDMSPRRKLGRKALKLFKRVGYRIYRLSGELTAIALGVAFIWFSALNVVVAQQNMRAGFVTDNAKIWFSEAFEGKSSEIDDIRLQWRPVDNTLDIITEGIQIKGEGEIVLQSVDQVNLGVSVNRLIRGEFDMRRVELSGATLTWARDDKGRVTLSLGAPDAVDTFAPLMRLNLSEQNEQNSAITIPDYLRLSDGKIYVTGPLVTPGTTFENTDILLTQSADAGSIDTQFRTNWTSGETVSPVDIQTQYSFEDKSLAAQGTLTWFNSAMFLQPDNLKVLDAVSDLEFGVSRTPEGLIGDIQLSASDGQLNIGQDGFAFSALKLKSQLNSKDQKLTIEAFEFDSPTLRARLEGEIENSAESENILDTTKQFDLRVSDLWVDRTDIFDNVFDIQSSTVSGSFNPDNRNLNLDRINVRQKDYELISTLDVDFNEGGKLRAISGEGRLEGEVNHSHVLDLWPTEFASGARRWIERAILAGKMDNVEFELDIPPSAITNGALENEHLNLSFDVSEAQVRYIETMSTLNDVSGRGELSGNRFDFDVTSGVVDTLSVRTGKIEIPRLNPKGGDFTIYAEGAGPIIDMMQLIDQKPFEFATRYGVDPLKFAGTGDIKLTVTRPLLEFFDPARIRYDIEGQFNDVQAPFGIGDSTITDGSVVLTANSEALVMKGPITMGDWQADLSWTEPLADIEAPTQYKLAGTVNRDTLDSFGLGFREYVGGDARVEIEALGQGLDIQTADIKADLQDMDLSIGRYWSKAVGESGQLTGRLSREVKGTLQVQDLKLEADGIDMSATVNLDSSGRLISAEIERAKIDGFMDAGLSIRPTSDREQINASLTGTYLDVSDIVDASLSQTGTGVPIPIRMNAELETLILDPTFVLEDVNLFYDSRESGVAEMNMEGLHNNAPMRMAISPDVENERRNVTISVPDAAQALSSFASLEAVRDGELQFTGTMPPLGETGAIEGQLDVSNVKLVQAPVFAQMLSLASLRGLSDLLGGEGVFFERVEVPFSFEKGRLDIGEAQASGAALGMTGRGTVDLAEKTVDFRGVLIPAYTANSALGSIPVIGDIFVGKQGEGVFALTYSVAGPFSQTQISVNPFSALTPGFLRQIFDSDSPESEPETEPDDTEVVTESVAPDEPATPDE